ncbi:MAG: biopolymer transporter ExbD [Cryomorphaceae bacterium]|nr:biopolymer transporter ExbD [Cryomorphaceae bacterium]
MSKFKKKSAGGRPGISTASLPDIVFMLLFFFMVTTVMREVDLKLKNEKPFATEVKKLEKRSLVSYIYIGSPKDRYQAQFGREPRVQLNDQFARLDEIQPFAHAEKQAKSESERPLMQFSIKADKDVRMGIVSDVKLELRKAEALKINYSTRKGVPSMLK